MPEELPELISPYQMSPAMMWAIIIILGVLFLAIMMEVLRRRRELQLRLRAEWAAAESIATDKDLSAEERAFLMAFLRKHSPRHPLRAATVRHEFDACVAADLASLGTDKGPSFEQRGQLLRDIRRRLGLDFLPIGHRIQSTRELYLGQAVWVSPKSGADSQWFRMKVEQVDEAILRLGPAAKDLPVPPAPGTPMKIRLWRDEDARYTLALPLLRVEEEPLRWVFPHTTELRRTQSRAHFRVHFEQSVSVGVVDAPVDNDYSNLAGREVVTRLRGRLTSLSGGGLAVLLDQPVPKQVLLRLNLDLGPGKHDLEVHVRPVDLTSIPGGRHLVRGSLVEIGDADREAITHFVFTEQQRQAQHAEHLE